MSLTLLAMLGIATAQPADTTVLSARQKADSVRTYTAPSISVTSLRATERQTPVVFNDISRVELRERNTARDIPDLLSTLPSVMFYSENGNSVGYTNLTMRGFDQRRIAVYINGVPQNDPEDHNVYWINFPDMTSSLHSIQVQRGAGMVNYGAAAIGGSVNMTTSAFADQRFVRGSFALGWQSGLPSDWSSPNMPSSNSGFNISRISCEVSSGLIDNKYAVYARYATVDAQGFRDQSWADLQSYHISAVRFDSVLRTQINVFGGPVADGLAYTGLPKAWVMDRDQRRSNLSYWEYDAQGNVQYATPRRSIEIENFEQPHYEVLNDWNVADNIEIKSALFYYAGNGFFDYDASWATSDMLGLDASTQLSDALVRANVTNSQVGWIPRIVWTNAYGQFTGGIELRDHLSRHWGKLRFANGLPAGYDPDTKFYEYRGTRGIMSAFARQMWQLTDDVSLNTELQVVRHTYGIEQERQRGVYTTYLTTKGDTVGNGGELFDVQYIFANPRLGVNWNIDEQQSAFVSLAYTSREPRRNNLYAASEAWYGATPRFAVDTTGGQVRYDFTQPLVKPERMLDVETQYSFATKTLQASVTGYWMEFADELVKNGQRDIFGLPIEGNAPRTRHIGIELQAAAELWRSGEFAVSLWGNATLSRNRIIEYAFVTRDGAINLAGNQVAGFPDRLVNLGLRASAPDVMIEAWVRNIGAFKTDNFGSNAGYDNTVDAATVVNLNAWCRLASPVFVTGMRYRLQVQNLFDTVYAAGGNGIEFFAGSPRTIYLGVDWEL
ncbi:MAG: TonB-dependent receptor [Candidatus Kapabacteria bacterium]|nr:TonB-dependent receptor [Candidatus Kapabacteria bacterium]